MNQPDITIHLLNQPNADIEYLDALLTLVKRAEHDNASPYMYPNGAAFYTGNLQGNTLNVAALDGDRMVGYAALRPMNPWPEYLDPTDLPPEHCALMLLNVVDPIYRGLGIGKRLAKARIEMAREAGFHHLFVTVHPENLSSIAVLEHFGFRLVTQKPMFSNQLLRNLMQLDLDTAPATHSTHP